LANGHILGGTLWADYSPNWVPSRLSGIGLEVEARDLSFARSSSLPSNLREDVAEGGLIYSWRHYRSVRPYAKFEMGYGNADYKGITGANRSQSRTIVGGGGGVEFRVTQRIWVRADYEYQSWPDFFKNSTPAKPMNPQGFTVGALYHFNTPHFFN
jgi:hypothetical protein